MADAAANQSTVKGSLPLYSNPQPLNNQLHKGKGLRFSGRPFDFLKEAHFVPVTIGEFAPAGTRFPVIFLGDTRTPVAAMGLQTGANLFVDPQTGQFEDYAYIPAYIRRYPFVAATHQGGERFTICIDEGSHLFSDDPEEPFFNENGEPTEFTNRAIEYVRRFESDIVLTNQFVEKMKELDLFDQQQATFQPRDAAGQAVGEAQVVASYWGISGEKLRNVPAETLVELRDNGYLGAIFAHMLSQTQWEFIIQRASRRNSGQNGQTPQPGDLPPPPNAPEA